jgi:hypothetical protein
MRGANRILHSRHFFFKSCSETFHVIKSFWQAHNPIVLGVAEKRVNSLNNVPQEENK